MICALKSHYTATGNTQISPCNIYNRGTHQKPHKVRDPRHFLFFSFFAPTTCFAEKFLSRTLFLSNITHTRTHTLLQTHTLLLQFTLLWSWSIQLCCFPRVRRGGGGALTIGLREREREQLKAACEMAVFHMLAYQETTLTWQTGMSKKCVCVWEKSVCVVVCVRETIWCACRYLSCRNK